MKDRLRITDALVFGTLLQQDAMGLYWTIWQVMSGAFLLDLMKGPSPKADAGARKGQARGGRTSPVDHDVAKAPWAGAGELSRQSKLLDAA